MFRHELRLVRTETLTLTNLKKAVKERDQLLLEDAVASSLELPYEGIHISIVKIAKDLLRRIKEELASRERALARLEKELEDKEGIFLKLKREIEAKEKDLNTSKVSIDDLQGKMSTLAKEKEELANENDKLNQEARTFHNRLFELQAEIINKEIEIARAKKEQVGPIVKKKR